LYFKSVLSEKTPITKPHWPARIRTRGVAWRVMETRARRAARAYRMFVVERTWIRHQYGLFLVAVACAVSLVRKRMFLTLPILTDEVNAFGAGPAGALARAVGRLLEPRWMAVVLCPSMLACALFRPLWYAARFERACDLVHMLGWLTRHGLNNFDGSRAIIEANYLTYLLRPVVVVASALSFRYEFSKQWKVHALRLLLDIPLNVYRGSGSPAVSAGEPANGIVDARLALAGDYAFMLASICLVDFAFEARDRADFAKRVRVRSQARYASADSVVAAEGTRRRQRGEGSSRDGGARDGREGSDR